MVSFHAGAEPCSDNAKQRPHPVVCRAFISGLSGTSDARHGHQRDLDRSGVWPANGRAIDDHCDLHHQRDGLLRLYKIHAAKLDYQRLP